MENFFVKEIKEFPFRTIHFFLKEELTSFQENCLKSFQFHNPGYKLVIHCINKFLTENSFFVNNDIETTIINILKITNDLEVFRFLNYTYGGCVFNINTICLQSLEPCFNIYEIHNRTIICKNESMILSKVNTLDLENAIKLSEKNFDPNGNNKKSHIYLNSNKIDLSKLISSYAITLYKLYEIKENTNLEKIMNIGLGREKFYDYDPIEEEINYINLYKRPERNLFFIATWNRIFKNLIRFDAILTQGKIKGAGKSHYTIVKESKNPYTIVLEDDAIPVMNFFEEFPKVLEDMKNNLGQFDLLTLATPTLVNKQKKTAFASKITENLIRISNCSSAHFIIYTPTIIPYFIKFYDDLETGKTTETDQDWYFNLNQDIRKVVTNPFLSFQYFGFVSDIVNCEREESFFLSGENQLKQIVKILNKRENLYRFIPDSIIKI